MRSRAWQLRKSKRFRGALRHARDEWNARHPWALGGSSLSAIVRSGLAPVGMVEAPDDLNKATATREWLSLVAGLANEFFPGWPIGVSQGHPASSWVAAALIADEDEAPLTLVVVEPLQPTYDHPYPWELEYIVREAIGGLDLAGDVKLAAALKARLAKAQHTTRFAWPFVPHLDETWRSSRPIRAREMRSSGATIQEIADTLGVDERQVRRWGVGPRGGGGAPGLTPS